VTALTFKILKRKDERRGRREGDGFLKSTVGVGNPAMRGESYSFNGQTLQLHTIP
jgi:hypothetical protein